MKAGVLSWLVASLYFCWKVVSRYVAAAAKLFNLTRANYLLADSVSVVRSKAMIKGSPTILLVPEIYL